MAKQPKRGFKEYVKNPDLFHKEVEESEKAASKPLSQKEIADRVATIGKQKLEWEELQRLKRAGDKVVPALLVALRDEKFLFHHYGKSVRDGSAIETALNLLEPFGLPEANLLKPALNHPDDYFRSKALYYLAHCGNDDAIEVLVEGLESPSEDCRAYALMGLCFLENSSRGSKRFRAALFDAVVPRLADEEFNAAEQAPRALLALDPERAKTVLLSKEIFGADNEFINKVLDALKDASVAVPGPQLRALLAEIKPKAKAGDYPFDRAYKIGLILLARVEGSGSRDLIDEARKWGNETVQTGAAEALEIAAGVHNAYGFVTKLYQEQGVEGLSEPQLDYLALYWLDAEVRNGGFSQFYFNSAGEFAPFAVKAAQRVGALELAKIIQEANLLFGKNGPNADRDKRMAQLGEIDDKALSELGSRYYECPNNLRVILPKFAADHAGAFKPRE